MTVPAGPLLFLGFGSMIIAGVALVRSFIYGERELFAERVTDVYVDLSEAIDRGEVSDSPRARFLLQVASVSSISIDLITPAKLAAIIGEHPQNQGQRRDTQTAPKADRHALDRYWNLLNGAWVRLLLLGSPSGWIMLALMMPRALSRFIARRRQVKRTMSDAVVERIVRPTDVQWLRPVASVHHHHRDPVSA